MDFTVGILLGTFLLSIVALFIFIWSMSTGLFGDGTAAATEIFAPNELGQIEDPAATAAQKGGLQQAMGPLDLAQPIARADEDSRNRADQSTSLVVGVCLTLAVVWLTGPATIADRAQARAQAVALVDNVPMQPVPPVGVGVGLILGLAGAATIAAAGFPTQRP